MEKSYSQNVAGIFETLSYLMLLPAAAGLFFASGLILWGIKDRNTETVLFGLAPYLFACIGVTLLVGYCKHARGRLAEKRVAVLWTATMVYNFLLLLPCLVGLESAIIRLITAPFAYHGDSGAVIFAAPALFYAAVVYYANKARASLKDGRLY
ncbi:MAG TPA: hypothetical protein VIL74_04130 [Pyrinomonadaceae bacterium]|jgi:hypothetical protein